MTVCAIFKKNDDLDKENYRPDMLCLTCQKPLKGSCTFKLKILCKISYQNCLHDSEKIITPNTA